MKKILIIADGILAKQFLEKIMGLKGNKNLYTILAYRNKTLPKKISKKYDVYFFDPTSFSKLSKLINENNFYKIMVVMNKKIDLLSTYENIRRIDKDIAISLIDRWGMDDFEDANLSILCSKELTVSRFLDFLPNRPVIARNVGLNQGEVMEVSVPIGSSFLYRHLASIEQKKWRIVAVYRNKNLLLARPTLMIRPSDVLLLVGEPNILANVYKSINQESGQFPQPFGNNIYAIIDMQKMNEENIKVILNDALILHSNLNNKNLHVRVINPTYSKMFDKIRSYEKSNISINVEYYQTDIKSIIREDMPMFDVGLVVTDGVFLNENMAILQEEKLPVLKIGLRGISAIKMGAILATDNKDIEKESSVILDFCSQLDLKINLYSFDPSDTDDAKSLLDHFEYLSKLFSKEVNIINSDDKNPLLTLKSRNDFIQFVPFYKRLTKKSVLDIFSTDMDRLSYKLEDNYQLFIPVEERKVI